MLIQTAVTLVLVVVVGGWFYSWRTSTLDAEAAAVTSVAVVGGAGTSAGSTGALTTTTGAAPAKASPLGDMTTFIAITQDTLDMLSVGKQSDATTRITDLESAWDNAQATLKRRNGNAWTAASAGSPPRRLRFLISQHH